jgi:adenosylmethionine-8-amino-7-oxononanoate aminotransferase
MDYGNLIPRNFRSNLRKAVKAEGIYIYDEDGREYIDGCCGALISSFGHGNREIIQAISDQLNTMEFAHPSRWRNDAIEEAAKEVASIAPEDLNDVWFVSGGSEAIESAMKLSRQYFVERDGKGSSKQVVIGRWNSYHGSTLGTMALAGSMARRRTFYPMFREYPKIESHYCYRCPYGLEYPSCGIRCAHMLESTIRQIGPEYVAAFFAEPVVGSTVGALNPPEEYWPIVREICDKYDVLLVADEIMTGIGRTGKYFCVQHWDVVPDIIASAKALSGGYSPAGAIMVSDRITDIFKKGSGHFEHGHTYNGNPVTGAAITAAIKYIKKHDIVKNSAVQGEYLSKKLKEIEDFPYVGQIRGIGLMRGIELVMDKESKKTFPPHMNVSGLVTEEFMKEGLVVYPGKGMIDGVEGDQFMIAPPLIVTEKDIDELVRRLKAGLQNSAKIIKSSLRK